MKKIITALIFILQVILSNAQRSHKPTRIIELPKNYVAIRVYLPIANNFNYYNYYDGRSLSSINLLGLGIGVLYKSDKGDFSLTGGLNFPSKTPITDNFEKVLVINKHEIGSFLIDALHHRKVNKKINVIGGLNFQKFIYTLNDNELKRFSRRDNGIGLTVGGELTVSSFFAPTLLFRPVIIPLGTQKYYHTLSLIANINAPVVNRGKFHKR